MQELKNKFDMGFNKIIHKIDMKVKKRLSSHHQSFITIHARIQTSYIPGGGVCFRLGSGCQEILCTCIAPWWNREWREMPKYRY